MANGAWKIARRSNAQLPLVIVVALAVALVLLGRAQSSLFDSARTRLTDWLQPVLGTLHGPVQTVDRWAGSVDQIFDVYQENIRLKDENARLRQWHTVAVVMQDRVAHYQGLLHVVPDPGTNSVLARVIGRANRPFLETMILDAGKSNNIKPGEAVVDSRGMIGRIYLAGQRTSWVILLTDLNSRVPVTIAHNQAGAGNTPAIMSGDNTAMPTLDTLSQMVKLRVGDQVISSGDGGLLPPDLPIGTVVGEPGRYRVALLADAAASEDVEVLAFRRPPEQVPTAVEGQLPAVAAGLPPAGPAPVPAAAPPPAATAKPAASQSALKPAPAKIPGVASNLTPAQSDARAADDRANDDRANAPADVSGGIE